jgi:dipeptidyl aminopeptidase/acylaminoacyl peptidase
MNKRIHHLGQMAALPMIFMVGFAATTAGADDRKPWQVEDSFRTRSMSELQISPRGDRLLFVVAEKNLEQNRSYTGIWAWSKSSMEPAPLTDRNGSASSPRWSPDGRRIAYFASDKNGLGLWTMNANGSGKKRLTGLERSNAYLAYGGPGNQLSWSPDGKTLAFSAAGPRFYKNDIEDPHLPTGNDVMVIDRLLHKAAYFYSDLRRTHIWTIPATGGQARQITPGDYDYHSFSWSPDGDFIACVSNQTGADDFNSNTDILLVSTREGGITRITSTDSPEYQVLWSPDGSTLAFEGRERAGRSKESDAELIKIYTMPANGGEPVNLTASLDRWANAFQWSPQGDEVYFTVQNEGRVELHRAVSDGSSAISVISERGQVGGFSVADDGAIYYVFQDFTNPAEIYRLDAEGSGKTRLTNFNESFVEEVNIVDAEYFSYRSFDGLSIDGWIMKPVGFQEGESYPLVLDVHGGPHGQYGYRLSDRLQELAANGYAVLFVNPRGSTGRGQEFSDLVVGDIGGGDYRDIMIGLDFAIDRFSFIDAENMGVTGVSYGGYLTNWITTHTDRFKAAVPISGISNLISAWSEGSNFLWFESDMERMPFENYEKAWDVSPLKYIENASTPTLFINGRWDFITSLNQADAMFVALKKLGVDTRIALYPHEGHGVGRQPVHTADYHRRSIDWFDRYLK